MSLLKQEVHAKLYGGKQLQANYKNRLVHKYQIQACMPSNYIIVTARRSIEFRLLAETYFNDNNFYIIETHNDFWYQNTKGIYEYKKKTKKE